MIRSKKNFLMSKTSKNSQFWGFIIKERKISLKMEPIGKQPHQNMSFDTKTAAILSKMFSSELGKKSKT